MRCIPYHRAAFRRADLSKYLPNDTAAVILAGGARQRGMLSRGYSFRGQSLADEEAVGASEFSNLVLPRFYGIDRLVSAW